MNDTSHLTLSLDEQILKVMAGTRELASFRVSTSAKGMGNQPGSLRTPTGRFRIDQKIGDGMPRETVFRERIAVDHWDGTTLDEDLIISRILWLDGLEDANRNTRERFIYIHGTNHESSLGQPNSHGCIRMSGDDIIQLYGMVDVGTEIEILPATRTGGKLCFLDCDSTLSTIEGIDELGRARGEDVFRRVEALTHAAMNGEVPIAEVFSRRMDMIRPDRALCEQIACQYIDTMVEGADRLVAELRSAGWTPVILSGGFAPLIAPLARNLGISHVEAVPIHFHDDGSYAGYGADYPTTRNLGKNEIIRQWKAALRPEQVVMVGDGVSDLETKPDVDRFIGFGGVVARPKVREGADYWLTDMRQRSSLWQALEQTPPI
jgi:HAD superfamily phosphoserine phosphatase-like hydrolase